jgi:hypothetical protein
MTTTEELAVVEQLNKLETAKLAIREAIIRKHVNVGASTPFEKYADAIDLIDSGIGGTYGKTKALFPLPPEGNYGGGINWKMAWKPGEVATLIKGEEDYPDEPTCTITSDEEFEEWVNFDIHKQTTTKNYTTVLIKNKSNNNPYILKHTLEFELAGTERLFAENGVVIEWDANHADNISTTSDQKSYHTRFAIQKSSLSMSDRCYIQNLTISCKNAKSKAIKNIYLIRGIEIKNNGFSIGNLFEGYKILSRIYVETTEYRAATNETLNWNGTSDTRDGAVIEVASGANILDVTIVNKSPGTCCIAGFEGGSSGKLIRCYLLGLYNKGINISNDHGSLVDRCFIQKVITTTANTAAINAGTIINSFIDCHESEVPYNTTLNAATNDFISATFKAYVKIEGCKVNIVRGSRIVAFLSSTDVINNAVLDFIFDGAAFSHNPIKIIQGTRFITGNVIYRVGAKSSAINAAFNFIGIEGNSGATIKDNVFGDLMFNSSINVSSYPFTIELIKSANLVEGNQINNFNFDLGVAYSAAFNASITIKIISSATFIKNNYIRDINFDETVYTGASAGILTIFEGGAEISNNVIDTVSVHENYSFVLKAITGLATLIKENRIGVIKMSAYGLYSNQTATTALAGNIEVNGIFSETANAIITQNAIDSILYYTHAGNTHTLRGIYSSGLNSEVTKNLIGKIKSSGSPITGKCLMVYGIDFKPTSGKVTENNLKLNIVTTVNAANVTSAENQFTPGLVNGIALAYNNVEVSDNVIDILSSVTPTVGIQGGPAAPTVTTKNKNNKVSVVALGETSTNFRLFEKVYNLNDTSIIEDRIPNITTWYNNCFSDKSGDSNSDASISGNNETRDSRIIETTA